MDNMDVKDMVEDAAMRLDCIADLFCAATAREFSMSESGLTGFLLIINQISEDLRKAIDVA